MKTKDTAAAPVGEDGSAAQPSANKHAAIEAALFKQAAAASNWADEDEETAGAAAVHSGDGWNQARHAYSGMTLSIPPCHSPSHLFPSIYTGHEGI